MNDKQKTCLYLFHGSTVLIFGVIAVSGDN